MHFLGFLIAVREYKCYLWNRDTKMNKIDMSLQEIFVFLYLTLFNLTLTFLRAK